MDKNNLSMLPHYKNIDAGLHKWDPVHASLFECFIELPNQLQPIFGEDAQLLPQHVKTVSGLDVLQKTAAVGEQKFMGVTVSYAQPVLDTTAADITMTLNLNLRQSTDNYILKIFKAWGNLNYDMSDGTRGIKVDYISNSIKINQANRNGQIWRSIWFRNVILTSVTNIDSLDYSSTDALELNVGFRSDFWEEDLAGGDTEWNENPV